MKYQNIKTATFLSRPNRFIAKVEIAGREETVHVKNTGRCKELLIPGTRVILEESGNPNRKTKYDLVSVYKNNQKLFNIDSQAPNRVVKEWLEGENTLFPQITAMKPEYTYGKSRIDFMIEQGEDKILMEVKGVTLEEDGVGYFPDAPTERGIKHIQELIGAVKEGYLGYLAFVIQMEGIKEVYPNDRTHKAFGDTLRQAVKEGVKVLFLGCLVTEDELKIDWVKDSGEGIFKMD